MKSLITFFLLFLILFVNAQNEKFNTVLLKELTGNTFNTDPLRVLVKGDISSINALQQIEGFKMNYAYGNIACISATPTQIINLALNSFVTRIELIENKKLKFLNDTMRVRNNITPVQLGASPLTQPYLGDSVIMGMIDSGHDFNHPDFKDTATGKSRILKIWDQSFPVSSNTPGAFGYGQEWDSTAFNSNNCPHTDITYYGHGTHTAGIAGGNGGYSGQCVGVAPKSEFISVALDFYSSGPTISDAVHYIFSNASALGKPCVINASVGDYYGSHDGKDLQSQIIDAMLQTPGRLLVGAAGNSGSYKYHVGYNAGIDTNFTFISSASNTLNFQLYSDVTQFQNLQYRIGVNSQNFVKRGDAGFKNFNFALGSVKLDTVYNGGNRLGIVQTVADTGFGLYTLDVTIFSDSSNYKWRIDATGSGRFDSWNFDYVNAGLPSITNYPEMVYYKHPDSLMTVVSGFQCLDNVVTVGNYINMTSWYDVNNNLQTIPYTTGQISSMSSQGPTRDGRLKPDITASGDQIFSSGVISLMPTYIVNNPSNVSQDSLHVMGGGTSSSSPVVAGLGALFLEMQPNANPWLFRQAITQCAKQDNFTGNSLPNTVWGYGKLDGFSAMTCSALWSYEKFNQNQFRIYPNPFKDALTIDFDKQNISGLIEIYDVLSRKVFTESLKNSNKYELDFRLSES
ncbi:MAG: S8 family serine peptidase, partial [Bacteroidota bacterium]